MSDDWTRQFSVPEGPVNEAVFETVVTAHGTAVASWLLTKHAGVLAGASDGLTQFIRSWVANPGLSLLAWDISIGRAHLALKEGKLDPVEAGVRIGLRIATFGHEGKWRAQFPPTSFYTDHLFVERACKVEVECDISHSVIRFDLADGTKVEWRRNGKDASWTHEGGGELESVGSKQTIRLLFKRALPPEDRGGEIFKECQPVETITSDMARSFSHGLEVIARNAAQYVPWVERVLHGIVVCPKQAEFRLVSGSWEDVPGLVHMSSPHSGIDIAEILVHECAHQYFYMLQRIGPVDDSSDREVYWSPPIRKHRPLSRILMAYHALANVQILYEAVRANQSNARETVEYVRINEPDLQDAIKTLDQPLRNNRALTKFGRGLYEPLAARMAPLIAAPV
jgi:hypothetical protein